MIVHPPAWDAMASTGFGIRPAVRVTAYRPGSTATLDVPVTSGTVTKDAGTYPRTRVTLDCADTSLIPITLSDLLQPNGNWLAVDYGYADPGTEVTAWLRIHDGPITRVLSSRPGSLLTIESADPTILVSGDDQWAPTTYATGTNYAAKVAEVIVTARYATTVVNTLTAAQKLLTVPVDWSWTGDPWAAVEYLMDLIGGEAYLDSTRALILRPHPITGTVAFAFRTGETGTITGYDSEQVRPFNSVQLLYTPTAGGTANLGLWEDLNPSSPTYVNGPMGRYVYTERRIGTVLGGVANLYTAPMYARRVRGRGRTVTLRAVPVPWIEPGDLISVTTVGGPVENMFVQTVSIPLDLSVMTITTRDPTYQGPM